MEDQTQNLTAETQAIKKAYAALNRNDIEGFSTIFDPQIERIEPPDFPSGGTYHGIEAVKTHVAQGRSTWAEGSCEPERFIVSGDKVVVSLHIRVRLNDHTDWIEGRIADVYTFRNGKAFRFRTFADEQQALDYAGVKDPGGNSLRGTNRSLTMKAEFEVLKSRPRIAFTLDRDSVCAADDCEMHETSVETHSFIDAVVLAEDLSSSYLPSVAGYGHWWECILNGTVIAKVFSNGKAEKIDEIRYLDENTVYFKYHSARF